MKNYQGSPILRKAIGFVIVFCIAHLLFSCAENTKDENNMAASFYEYLKSGKCNEISLVYNAWSTIDFEEEIPQQCIKKANLSEYDLLKFKHINKKLDFFKVQPKNVFEGCAMTDSLRFPGFTQEYIISILSDTMLSSEAKEILLPQKEPSNIIFIFAHSVPYFRTDSLLAVVKTSIIINPFIEPLSAYHFYKYDRTEKKWETDFIFSW